MNQGLRNHGRVLLLCALALLAGCGRIAPGSVAGRSAETAASGGGGSSGGSSGGYQGLQCYGQSGCAQYSNTTNPNAPGYVRPPQ